MSEGEADLRAILETLDPLARDALRRVLIHDQADRDAIASQLLRYGDERGDDWADIIDMLTLHPEARRKVVRLLAELGGWRGVTSRHGIREDRYWRRRRRGARAAGREGRTDGNERTD